MKTMQIEKRVFEHGDVIELRGNDRPNKIIGKDEEKIGVNRFIILDEKVKYDGRLSAKALGDDFQKYTIFEQQLDKAEYIGKMDLSILECL